MQLHVGGKLHSESEKQIIRNKDIALLNKWQLFTNILSKLPLLETVRIKIASSNTRIKLLKLNVVWKTYCKLLSFLPESHETNNSGHIVYLILWVVVGNTTTSKQIKKIGDMHVAVPAQFCPFSSFYKS